VQKYCSTVNQKNSKSNSLYSSHWLGNENWFANATYIRT
jgi:hypothetical protein